MAKLTAGTFDRPADLSDTDDPSVLYARSYLLIRVVVGGIGVLLPTLLFLLDWFFIRGLASVRGSLSAYYFTAARDLFVGALCVTGFFLITYMAGQKSTWDYWLSTLSGVAALGVAFFPTNRPPNVAVGSPLCGAVIQPVPPSCTQLQQAFGEAPVATVHYVSAGIFILSLAAICFIFGYREKEHAKNVARERFHQVCGAVILAAVAWVFVGGKLDLELFGLTPLYIGEIISVYAFGVSWLVKAQDLFKGIFRKLTS